MHPRTPDLLGALCHHAELVRRADAPVGDRAGAQARVEEALQLRDKPNGDGERLIDDATVFLAQCLANAEREGLAGDPTKWVQLANCLRPWVATDAAMAVERKYRAATTEQER